MTAAYRVDNKSTLADRFDAMAEQARALGPREVRVADREAVRAELDAWADSRREVNSKHI